MKAGTCLTVERLPFHSLDQPLANDALLRPLFDLTRGSFESLQSGASNRRSGCRQDSRPRHRRA